MEIKKNILLPLSIDRMKFKTVFMSDDIVRLNYIAMMFVSGEQND